MGSRRAPLTGDQSASELQKSIFLIGMCVLFSSKNI